MDVKIAAVLRKTTLSWRLLVYCVAAAPLFGQARPPVAYTLDLRQPATHLIGVTMTVPGSLPGTEIQFPAWNALYQFRDFVRNVQDVEARCDGRPQALERVDLNTWRSGESSCAHLEIRYAVFANQEGPFSAALTEEHAFMNFALLLFYLPGDRARPMTVKFLLPEKWKLATLLENETSPGEFVAADYDDLADCPAEAGSFDEYSYRQGGATYRVIVHAGRSAYSSSRLLETIEKITAAETAAMQDVPFSRYTFFLHFLEESGGGMEHRSGTAISYSAAQLRDDWSGLETVLAHEFFHAWDVKRIRPQSLEPVDYVHGNDTRDLWFAEGFASTYQQYAVLRAGLISREAFYQRLAGEIQILQARPARLRQSVVLAGREAWLEKYPDYLRPERSISYYNKGALVGFLLDLAIRQGSGNRHSLDDLMRRLNEDFARRNRFYRQQDLIAIAASLAPRFEDVNQFFADYVDGTRELDYERFLGYAGLTLSSETVERPAPGFRTVAGFEMPVQVESVERGGNAQKAGLEAGDEIIELDGKRLERNLEDMIARMKPGQTLRLRVRRAGRELAIEFVLGGETQTLYRVGERKQATPRQRRIREGWLRGITREAGEP
ncbi:MAG: M61 family metallopeptidase [Terriglobia bacterium]